MEILRKLMCRISAIFIICAIFDKEKEKSSVNGKDGGETSKLRNVMHDVPVRRATLEDNEIKGYGFKWQFLYFQSAVQKSFFLKFI